jgi:hypothetical protein
MKIPSPPITGTRMSLKISMSITDALHEDRQR